MGWGRGAPAYEGGCRAFSEPAKGDGAINLALRRPGVQAPDGMDAFDYLGLSRYRHTSDWKKAAS